jgi:iron complex outermembrane recepter protein
VAPVTRAGLPNADQSLINPTSCGDKPGESTSGEEVTLKNGGVRMGKASSTRRVLLTATLLAFAVPGSFHLHAQEVVLEEVIVTGSRISRPDFISASPIVSVTEAAFEQTGSASVDTVMNRLPQFVPDMTSSSNNPSNGGQGNLQLRGLGASRTLVLLDGRRLVPANGTGVVDVNIIPSTLIESVEVITGGASAVYGSDAIAGVVNFRLKQDFEGLEFDGRYGLSDGGDAEEYSVGITAGLEFADGRGQVYGHLDYSEREALTYSRRDFSKYALGYFGPDAGGVGPDKGFLPLGSTLIEEGRPSSVRASQQAYDALFASYGFPPGSVPYQTFFGVNQDGSLFTMGTREPGSVVNFRGRRDPVLFNDRLYTYNYAPWNYLQLPLERISGFAAGSSEIGAGHEVYAQALYSDYSADQALAPTPNNAISIPATNPYVPADLAFLLESRSDPAADFRIAKRLSELGPRIASNQYDVYQLTAGVSGPISDHWTYEAYAQYGENDQESRQAGNALRSRINELTYAPDGGMSICGEFNILLLGHISNECAQYVGVGGVNRSGYEQTIFEASASGRLFSLPAGDVQVVVGAMHKRDQFLYRADPIASVILEDGLPDIIGFNASDDIEGSDNNTDVYLEALVPLLAGVPGAERLEVVLGYRHSDYESAGGAESWKAELLYQPIEPLRLRGSLQRAVRAPSVFELYLPTLPYDYGIYPEFGGVPDPCTAGSPERSGPDAARVEALCLAQGVPAALLPEFVDADELHLGVSGGNPELKPETGDTLTLGFVVDSQATHPLLSRMQLSLDWYRIEMDDAIEYTFATDYVPRCFDAATNPQFEVSNRWCSYFSRDATTGEIVDFQDNLVNIEGFELSGVDLQFDWAFDAGPGSLGLNLLASWLDYYRLIPPPGVAQTDFAGTVGNKVGGSLPEWKLNLDAHYAWQTLTVGAQWRYVDSMQDVDASLDYTVSSRDYLDVYVVNEFDGGLFDGLTLRLGVENLTDEAPPLVPTQVQANTDPSQYDVLGRRYYLNLNYRF